MSLFNAYLPNNRHEPRKQRFIEEVYKEIATDDPIPDGRYYLQIEIGGNEITSGHDFSSPTVKYIFKKQ